MNKVWIGFVMTQLRIWTMRYSVICLWLLLCYSIEIHISQSTIIKLSQICTSRQFDECCRDLLQIKFTIVVSSDTYYFLEFSAYKTFLSPTVFPSSRLKKNTFPLLIFHTREEQQALTAAHMFLDKTLNSKCFMQTRGMLFARN